MTPDPRSQPHAAAIAQLEWFNLSTYAARTLVALSGLGTGTAKDVSEVSDVPRTRVYDAVDELHTRGLVDIQQSNPQQFMAISSETLRRKFDGETKRRLTVLTTALNNLEPADRRVEQRGIWTVGEEGAIVDRLLEFFAEADDEIVYLAEDEYFTSDLIDGLSAADDRGVSITLGGLSTELLEDITVEVSTVSRIDAAARPPAINRLLLVDGSRTLASVRIEEPGPDIETAIWGAGKTNSLVVIFKSMFGLNGETIPDE
jgi:sugar-specific transcriptional regulator TrmB